MYVRSLAGTEDLKEWMAQRMRSNPIVPKPPDTNEGVMCPQVMKTCPDGTMVGYDLKVKDGCVYLPCPLNEAPGMTGWFTRMGLTSDWDLPVILGGVALLAYMVFKK